MMKKRDEGVTDYPLFTHREVDLAAKRWHTVPLHTRFDITATASAGEDADLSLEFFDAGHILGSWARSFARTAAKIFYTGDVQFDDQTILQGARFPEENWTCSLSNHARRPAHSRGFYACRGGTAICGRDQGRFRSRRRRADPAFRPRQDAGNPRIVLRVSPPGAARQGPI